MTAPDAAELTVLIANHNSSTFLELSLYAFDALTETPFRVLVHDDGSRRDDVEALERLAGRLPNVHVFQRPPSRRGGSFAHGAALDFLVAQVDTPYAVVFDADCTPLMHGWDTYLLAQLDERTKIVGSRLGEGWSGNKPIDFPLPFLALFDVATYRALGISAMPEDPVQEKDSCWQWRPKYLEAGYLGKTLGAVNTRFESAPPFEDMVCAVYFTDEGRMLGSHFGRGSNPAGKRTGMPRPVEAVLRRVGARRMVSREWTEQRDRWKAICRSVIEQQPG
jgi:glycosyltransferase involved in cell wall biosynthesis